MERVPGVLGSSILLPRGPVPALPKYVLTGASGGGETMELGIFAAIHGDEPAGPEAVAAFAELVAREPELVQGYRLSFYPVCNPTRYEAGSRWSQTGKDLNREFWRESAEPEVAALEAELLENRLHGFISLHADDTSPGMYGFVRGAVLARSLLEPALRAAEEAIPRNRAREIDGFPAENGIIAECYDGILTAPPKLQGSPFEIILESPALLPLNSQTAALVAAMRAILAEYRKFIAFAADL